MEVNRVSTCCNRGHWGFNKLSWRLLGIQQALVEGVWDFRGVFMVLVTV